MLESWLEFALVLWRPAGAGWIVFGRDKRALIKAAAGGLALRARSVADGGAI